MSEYLQRLQKPIYNNTVTHLVSQNANGAGSGYLVLPKPQGGEPGWDPQDKNDCCRAYNLTEDSDGEPAGVSRARLDPGPDGVAGRAHDQDFPQAPGFQHPHSREDENDVDEEIKHCQPVDGHAVDVVEVHEDVVYAAVLNPHEAVAHGVHAEDEEHDPSAFVQLSLHLGRRLYDVHS